MNICGLTWIRLGIQGARYSGHLTIMLKNLSSPNRIGATVKITRMIQKAWPTGLSK